MQKINSSPDYARQLLLRCSTSCIPAVVGNCSMRRLKRLLLVRYLLGNCSMRCSTSCFHAVVHPCSRTRHPGCVTENTNMHMLSGGTILMRQLIPANRVVTIKSANNYR